MMEEVDESEVQALRAEYARLFSSSVEMEGQAQQGEMPVELSEMLAGSGLSGPRNAGPKWDKALINEALTTWSAEMLADPTRMGYLMNPHETLEGRQVGGQEDEEDAGAQAEVAELERLIDMYRQEESRHDQVYEDLQHKAAEVEKMIAKLEAMQKELADCQGAWPAGVEEEEEKWLEEEKDGLDAETSKQLQQERAALESARGEWEALSRERADMASEVQALEAALGNLNAQVGGEEEHMAVGRPEGLGGEQEVEAEVQDLQQRIEGTRNLLGLLQDLYDCMVDVAEDNNPQQQHDQASSSDDEQQQQQGHHKVLVVTVTYPSQHVMRMRLALAPGGSGCDGMKLLSTQLEPPPASLARGRGGGVGAVSMMDILEVAAGLEAPHDMVFIAREVGQRIRAQAAVREQIRELQKRYIVKQSEAQDELTVTFPEGVVATCQLLPGYPELPGSLRLTSLVGVGGWKDGELAITCRELNHALGSGGLGGATASSSSLLSLVQDLHDRIERLNNSSSSNQQHEAAGDEEGGGEKNDSAP